MLRIRDVHTGYGRLEVLHGVSLEVGPGELVAVIGANGAGKTTLLRTVSGLVAASNGAVELDGVDVTGYPAERLAAAGLTHVPENRLVFPTLSVDDNLSLGAWTRRRSGGVEAQRQRVLELFPRLAGRRGQRAGTLSGGEQQMLAIARGLMAQPKVMVLDEPSLGLAPRVIGEIFAALGRLRDADRLAIVLVEQNARAAFKVADRILVMDRGSVVLSGPPDELITDQRIRKTYLGG